MGGILVGAISNFPFICFESQTSQYASNRILIFATLASSYKVTGIVSDCNDLTLKISNLMYYSVSLLGVP